MQKHQTLWLLFLLVFPNCFGKKVIAEVPNLSLNKSSRIYASLKTYQKNNLNFIPILEEKYKSELEPYSFNEEIARVEDLAQPITKQSAPTDSPHLSLKVKSESINAQPDLDSNENQSTNVWELEKKHSIPKSNSSQSILLVKELDRQLIEKKPKITSDAELLPKKQSQAESNYIIPPTVAPKEKINPFTTTLPLNDISVNHLTEWEIVSGSTFGDNINTTFSGTGTIKIDGKVEESRTRNNIFTVDQKGSYLQLRAVRESRKITVAKKEPQTLMGMEMQMSLIASCIFPERTSNQQCTYTPGLVTDRNSIEPDFFVPTRILQTANMGDVVTPESQAIMKLPGFQRGANGQEFGLDLYFPNAGAVPGNTQGNKPFYVREEELGNTAVGLYSQIRQVVRANHKKAAIGRTVRGFGAIVNDDNLLLNSAVQLGNFFLPDANPQLEGGVNKVNTNINKNLFFAANNSRLPTESFTFYHAGIGYADSLKPGTKKVSQIPKANFNSIWIGLSPIIERQIQKIIRYEPTGSQKILSQGGGEGGVDSNVSLLSVVNDKRFSSSELQDFYTQIYLKNYTQDVNFVNGSQYIENIKYYPHISLTGNITGSKDVFRYYGGVIAGNILKAYGGGDYTRNASGGWTFSAGAVGYINPDRDYYSQISGSAVREIRLSKKANLVLSSSINYGLDQQNRIGRVESESPSSSLLLGARANLGNVSLGLVNYFGNILPKSVENTLLADLEIRFGNNFRINAYYTPINETSSRSRYGASAQLRLSTKYNSPTLSFSWTNSEYDLGKDTSGNNISFTDNVFKVLFRFGAPLNPFDQVTAERLRRQGNQGVEKLQREPIRDDLEQTRPNPVAP